MPRLTPETLNNLRLDMARFMAVRYMDEIAPPGQPTYPYHLMICGGTACHASKSIEIKKRLEAKVEEAGLHDKVIIIETGCNGFCAQGPVMNVFPGGIFYQFLVPEDVDEIIEEHIIKGYPVQRLMYHDPQTGKPIPRLHDIPFFAMQEARVLRNRGLIAAERIEEYIGTNGYMAAAKALTSMNPEEIINEVKTSGIRGRGGAGFPTGLKWEFASKSKGEVKYILCNADEGDPGAFMDRSVLEADPHSVLEGMIIAAKAIGAHQGYIYCRAEYPLAVKRLNIALAQAREYGLLGKDILGLGFDFDIEIYRGAGAFVCGEETALMTSIEGKRGAPRPRPPFPAVQGLWKKPTVLNNVETLSSIPQIILKGGKWYAELGTLKSKGTKIFAITGDIKNVGLAEVPMGMSLGTIIQDLAGGIPKGKKFKAVQLGGPSGGCVPVSGLNTPVEYESIVQLGAIVGSGGMIVMDEDKCMVDVARFFMEFCVDESCGKCTPCRVGTRQMLNILTRICHGQGREGDIEALEKWAGIIQNTALCGLGQTAPNPVLSTLRYFRHEYEAHIKDKRCPAVACADLYRAPCQHACPAGMDVPAYVALVRAGRLDDAYRILLRTNPFPSVCGRVCDHKCESKCRRSTLDEPVNIKYLKRYITDSAPRPRMAPIRISRLEKIAVIGAGPSGLTAARELALRGYAVTVFESLPEPGGMLRWGIPAYRLPREVIKNEIEAILELGVELRCRTKVGQDVSWESLKGDFDAIYLAVGAQKSTGLRAEGENLEGVLGAVEFLRELNLGRKLQVGDRVAVVGGGNSAIDAARSAIRLGAKEVTILYRRLREDMPAQGEEIHAAEEEGVRFEYLVSPSRLTGKNGRVSKIYCHRMNLGEFDASGRRQPLPIAGAEFSLGVDTVIAAIGQRPELPFAGQAAEGEVEVTRGGLIKIKEDTRTRASEAMIFAGGDVVTGPGMVIWAIAAGRAAAEEIDAAIRLRNGEAPYVSPPEPQIDIPQTIDEEVKEQPRAAMPELSAAERKGDFREVELGFSKEVALAEACRCLRCDVKEVEESAAEGATGRSEAAS